MQSYAEDGALITYKILKKIGQFKSCNHATMKGLANLKYNERHPSSRDAWKLSPKEKKNVAPTENFQSSGQRQQINFTKLANQ